MRNFASPSRYIQGENALFENAKTIASDMSALGFNLDFAPVADLS